MGIKEGYHKAIIKYHIRRQHSKSTLVKYLHATRFSLVQSTFIQAIQNDHFLSWPGLSAKLVTRHLSPTRATAIGHMNQERQGLQITKNNNEKLGGDVIKENIARICKLGTGSDSFQELLEIDIQHDNFHHCLYQTTRSMK